jgi:hypothetical protein
MADKNDTYKRGKSYREWKPKFLAVLSKVPVVAAACTAAGVTRTSAYAERKKSPAFAAQWDAAIEDAYDLMEYEGYLRSVGKRRREVVDIEEVHDAKGKVVSRKVKTRTAEEWSDLLLMFFLKGGRPEKYRERHEVTGQVNGTLTPGQVDALNKIYGKDSGDKGNNC